MRATATAEFRRAISEPWLSVPPVRVGQIPSGFGTPERYVTVQTGDHLLRIDIYPDRDSCCAFEDVRIWREAVVVGFGDKVFFVPFDKRDVKTLDLGGYFSSFHLGDDVLLAASASRIFRLSFEGDILWASEELGFDGVVVDRIEDELISGQGEWDPPGGWKPFLVSLTSGRTVSLI